VLGRLRALEEEVGVAVWSEGGLWGVVGEEFLVTKLRAG